MRNDEFCEMASLFLDVPERNVKKVKVRYRAGNGSLIRENIYIDKNDLIALYGIEDVTHKRKEPTGGFVECFVPSRGGVRRLSASAGKTLTVLG